MSEAPLRRRKRRSVALAPREECNAAPVDDLEREHDLAAVILIGAACRSGAQVVEGATEHGLSMTAVRSVRAAETLVFYTTEYDVRRRYADALVALRKAGRCMDWPDEPWSVKP